MEFAVGASAEVTLEVTGADTAQAFGSGDIPVLATPRVLALLEEATVAAVPGDAATTTVGTHVTLDHLAATPVGRTVTAAARLVAVDGRTLTFDVVLRDGDTEAARGRVDRVVVDRAKFIARAGG